MVGRLADWRSASARILPFLRFREPLDLFNHWQSLGDAARVPNRKSLDPLSIPKTLLHLFILDYIEEERVLRYRLAGEEIRDIHHQRLVGHDLGKIVVSHARDEVIPYFLECVERPAVTLLTGRLYKTVERPGVGERLLLPLISPEGRGLIGITRRVLDTSENAESPEREERILRICPLDGAPVERRAA